MQADYSDIRERITEEPTWYDANGTPRYGKFIPERCPDVYAQEVVLLRIACQHCGEQFDVEMHGTWFSHIRYPNELHYGDPPRHDCPIGNTENCDDLEVLQVWYRGEEGWIRAPKLEGPIK